MKKTRALTLSCLLSYFLLSCNSFVGYEYTKAGFSFRSHEQLSFKETVELRELVFHVYQNPKMATQTVIIESEASEDVILNFWDNNFFGESGYDDSVEVVKSETLEGEYGDYRELVEVKGKWPDQTMSRYLFGCRSLGKKTICISYDSRFPYDKYKIGSDHLAKEQFKQVMATIKLR